MVSLQWQYINMTKNISQYTVLKLMYLGYGYAPLYTVHYHNQQTNVHNMSIC